MKTHIIIFEGIDGSGKSSAVNDVVKYLQSKGLRVFSFKEPDGKMRSILQNHGREMSVTDEFMAMWIWRFQLWQGIVDAASHYSEDVYMVIDRSYASTIANQIEGRGAKDLEKNFSFWRNRLFELLPRTELLSVYNIYIRVTAKVGLLRVPNRVGKDEELKQFEKEEFLSRVKTGFDLFFGSDDYRHPQEKVFVVDGTPDRDTVMKSVVDVIDSIIE